MSTYRIALTVNGQRREIEVEGRTLLAHAIREQCGLTGTHIGCDTTSCGACTVLVDGVPVKSCTVLAVQADGCEVKTVEGLAQSGELHPLQKAFWNCHGLQCGFCTPGMLMTGVAFLERTQSADLTDDEVRHAISGNLCRCTGYMNIVKAYQEAAREMYGSGPGEENPAMPAVAAGKEE